jgi:TolB-like protein/thioredoxin-like negative regulator of GroEL
MSFFSELKRRNVIRVGIAYAVTGWVLVEVLSVLLPAFNAPDWVMRAVILLLVGGLPVVLLVAWFFELTPEGIKKEDSTDTAGEALFKARTERKADLIIISVLAVTVIYFIAEKIWLSDIVRGNMNSIAVLPFTDMSPRRDQQYFAEGLTVELLNMISRVTDLRVTGKTSAFQFKDYQGDFDSIGEKLNVGTILEGSVRAVDNNIRITTNLIDARQGHTLWSANYDRKLTNIFQVQDEIARAVVRALQAQLIESQNKPVDRVVIAEAYTAYLQGSFLHGKLTVEDQNAAIIFFQQAIEKDPGFAEPLVGMADANLMLALNMVAIDRDEGIGKATGYLDHALSLNNDLTDALVSKAFVKQVNFRDYVGAELDLKRALETDPTHIAALRRLGTLHGMQGRYDEALGMFQKIIDRDPLNTLAYSNYSYQALAAGKLDLAEEMIEKVLLFSPKSIFAHFQLARIQLARGDVDAAILANELEAHPVWKNIGVGMIACAQGDIEGGIAIADELIEQREIFNAAEIYYMCGDTDTVFELMQAAAEDRDPALTEMKLSWAMTPLRNDPRWIEILKLMGLSV